MIHPKVIVVTNVFTDQADRFGSVANTLAEIKKGVKRSPGSVLVLNAEDTQTSSLALGVPNKVIRYGLEETVGEQGNIDLTDAGKCPKCGGDVVIRRSKKGRRFFGCENPECSFISWSKPSEVKCPKCGGWMAERGTKLVCQNGTCGHSMNINDHS